jgi:ADP-ribose pyrophosphatase YjhB (NUDIX family)
VCDADLAALPAGEEWTDRSEYHDEWLNKCRPVRHSHVVYLLARMTTIFGPALLLNRHKKWDDWSLVGGHVEPDEMGDWRAAAIREADEELVPLSHGADFTIDALHEEPITWGPQPSRSAQGAPTIYHVKFYSLAFKVSRLEVFGQLPPADFKLVPESQIDAAAEHCIGGPVRRGLELLHSIEKDKARLGEVMQPLTKQERLAVRDACSHFYIEIDKEHRRCTRPDDHPAQRERLKKMALLLSSQEKLCHEDDES